MKDSVQIRQLSKETFASFKKVRDLSSHLYGSYQLYSKNGLKYLCKYLPKDLSFVSYRHSTSHILKYESSQHAIYLFPMPGDQITNFVQKGCKENHQNQIKMWIDKCGSVENCLWEVVKTLVRLIEERRLVDVLGECLRIHNGELEYCMDTWMKSAHRIVMENPSQLENYYFSQEDLQLIKLKAEQSDELNPSNKSMYFRVFMLVLHLGTSNLNHRNYEYGQFQLNRQHLRIRLEHFCSKYKVLGELTRKVIDEEDYSMEEVWALCMPQIKQRKSVQSKSIMSSVRSMKKSLTISKKNKENQERISIVSHNGKLNSSFVSEISVKDGEEDSYLMMQKSVLNLKRSYLKMKDENTSNKQNILLRVNSSGCKSQSNSTTKPKTKASEKDKQKTYKLWPSKEQFDLKHILLKLQEIPSGSVKLLRYLNLTEFLPSNVYQTKILEVLQNVHITSSWVKQSYENGSIYLGEMNNGQKQGKGLYVFGSNDFYFGDWNQNFMDGYGTYVFVSGEVYEGEIRKGFKEGHGKCLYEDGREYEGSWNKNCKVGLGKVKFPNDVTFVGVFKVNCNETEGLFVGPINSDNSPLWQNQGIFEHYNWQKNSITDARTPSQLNIDKKKKIKNCLSQFYSQRRQNDGSNYEGEMVGGKRQGFGIYQNNSQRYEGQWHDDQHEGHGILHLKGSFSIAGRWKDGLMVEYACDEEEDVIF